MVVNMIAAKLVLLTMQQDPKIIVIAGGTGLIGTRLSEILKKTGYEIKILTRNEDLSNDSRYVNWKPKQNQLDYTAIENCHAIINLAGAGIADQKWTSEYKKIVISSRVDSNNTLASAMEKMTNKPIYISASAIGYYGYHSGESAFEEDDQPGQGDFLQEVSNAWERASSAAGEHASRHATVRIGIVLAKEGGALQEMLRGFHLGIGSYFSPGDQIYSWIDLDDLCGIFMHLLENDQLKGIYNGVAPNPVSAKKLAGTIANKKYGRSLLMPVPKFASNLILGEQQQMLTGSCAVSSQKIQEAGFRFIYRKIEKSIDHLIE